MSLRLARVPRLALVLLAVSGVARAGELHRRRPRMLPFPDLRGEVPADPRLEPLAPQLAGLRARLRELDEALEELGDWEVRSFAPEDPEARAAYGMAGEAYRETSSFVSRLDEALDELRRDYPHLPPDLRKIEDAAVSDGVAYQAAQGDRVRRALLRHPDPGVRDLAGRLRMIATLEALRARRRGVELRLTLLQEVLEAAIP